MTWRGVVRVGVEATRHHPRRPMAKARGQVQGHSHIYVTKPHVDLNFCWISNTRQIHLTHSHMPTVMEHYWPIQSFSCYAKASRTFLGASVKEGAPFLSFVVFRHYHHHRQQNVGVDSMLRRWMIDCHILIGKLMPCRLKRRFPQATFTFVGVAGGGGRCSLLELGCGMYSLRWE